MNASCVIKIFPEEDSFAESEGEQDGGGGVTPLLLSTHPVLQNRAYRVCPKESP